MNAGFQTISNVEGNDSFNYSKPDIFLERAQLITSFNLNAKDFESLAHKDDIRFLFTHNFFNDIDVTKVFTNNVTVDALNNSIEQLRKESKHFLYRLYSYRFPGIGPGEIMLFYIIEQSIVSGGTTKGFDIAVGDIKYEVKAVRTAIKQLSNDIKYTFVLDFRLGGTVPISDIITDLKKLAISAGFKIKENEISADIIAQLRGIKKSKFSKNDGNVSTAIVNEFNSIEVRYKDASVDYFDNKKIIFMNNPTVVAKDLNEEKWHLTKFNKISTVLSIKEVQHHEVFIDRVTGNTIKPMIQIC